MNIAIVSTFDNQGGAARAAYRLHQGLRVLNHDSRMIVKYKKSDDPYVVEVIEDERDCDNNEQIFREIQHYLINLNRTEASNTIFSLPYPGYDLSKNTTVVDSEVINVHWVAYYQSVESLLRLLSLNKPIVWTLHDEWALSGGCHYGSGCDKYTADCDECPQLNGIVNRIPYHILGNKRALSGKNITIVTPSRWLADCARKSMLFRDCRIEVIPYSLETDLFVPINKQEAKKSFSIPEDSLSLLFGAEYHIEKRKGFRELYDAIRLCMKNTTFKNLVKKGKINIILFGNPNDELKKIGIPIYSLGYVKDDYEIVRAYSAADVYILPSREDNLPNTMLESMACGTPVVAFQVGGMPDMIENDRTGLLAAPFDPASLCEKILKMICDDTSRIGMGKHCRALMERDFKLHVQADKYIELFNDLLARMGGRPPTQNIDNTVSLAQSDCHAEIMGIPENILRIFCESSMQYINKKEGELGRLKNSYEYKVGKYIVSIIKKVLFKKNG